MHVGIRNAVHESSPWSNSSPSGPLVWVRRACFPSIPSETHPKTNWYLTVYCELSTLPQKQSFHFMGFLVWISPECSESFTEKSKNNLYPLLIHFLTPENNYDYYCIFLVCYLTVLLLYDIVSTTEDKLHQMNMILLRMVNWKGKVGCGWSPF